MYLEDSGTSSIILAVPSPIGGSGASSECFYCIPWRNQTLL